MTASPLPEPSVPTAKWKVRLSPFWPSSVPVSVIVRLSPGFKVPSGKEGPAAGTDEEVSEKPKGSVLRTATSAIGTVALLLTWSVRVSDLPATVSAMVSADIESGVEEIASGYESFLTKVALEPVVPYERESGMASVEPDAPKTTALTERVTVSPLRMVPRFSL